MSAPTGLEKVITGRTANVVMNPRAVGSGGNKSSMLSLWSGAPFKITLLESLPVSSKEDQMLKAQALFILSLIIISPLVQADSASRTAIITDIPRDYTPEKVLERVEPIIDDEDTGSGLSLISRAIVDLKQSIERFPNHAMLYVALARATFVAENHDYGRQEARRLLDKAIEINPLQVEAYTLKAVDALLMGCPKCAFEILNKPEVINSGHPYVYQVRGRIFSGYGNGDQAIKDYLESIRVQTNVKKNGFTYWLLAYEYYKQKKYDKAEVAYIKAIQAKPLTISPRNSYAEFLLNIRGDYELAMLVAGKALELKENQFSKWLVGLALYTKWANSFFESPRSKETTTILSQAKQMYPNVQFIFMRSLVYDGTLKTAKALLKSDLMNTSNIDEKDGDGDSALSNAVGVITKNNRDIELLEMILEKGANVNNKNSFGATPLHLAAYYDRPDIVRLLLLKGANVNIQSNYGYTPLLIAVSGKNSGVSVAKLLLQKNADTKIVDNFKRGALYYAALSGKAELVGILLDRGIDINIQDKDGTTPFIAAAGAGHKDVVELLLRKKVNVKIRSRFGDALSWATARRQDDIVKIIRNAMQPAI